MPSAQPMNVTQNEHTYLLRLKNVVKKYPDGATAVDGVNFAFRENGFLSLIGPSGCGKSTVLRLIAGLIAPSSGEILWRGDAPPTLGFVFQTANLAPWSNVFDNVYLPLRLKKISRGQAKNAVLSALERVGLADKAQAMPYQLSGGMAMRVSIARALVATPRLLLMDEPFAALDEPTRLKLNEDVSRIAAEESMSVVFVTHSVFEAVALSTDVAVFSSTPGKILKIFQIDAPVPRQNHFRLSQNFVDHARIVSACLATQTEAQL